MLCPYLGKATDAQSREKRPDLGHVCYAFGAQNPYWSYRPVELGVQDDLCMNGRAYLRCPRYTLAQQKGLEPPVREPVAAGRRSWWPF
jgi:hypothetical protein